MDYRIEGLIFSFLMISICSTSMHKDHEDQIKNDQEIADDVYAEEKNYNKQLCKQCQHCENTYPLYSIDHNG